MQIAPLVKAGFRVIAPDLRGGLGGESDAPKEVEGYDIPKSIVKDVAGASGNYDMMLQTASWRVMCTDDSAACKHQLQA